MARRPAPASAVDPWARLWMDTMLLTADAAVVVGLRTMRLMAGGPLAVREAERMVTEKVAASVELGAALASGQVRSPRGAARRALGVAGKRVRANRRRLG